MKALTKVFGEGQIAILYGVEESIFLDAIMFWYRTNRGDNKNYYDGRWWTYNSVKTYEDIFPWWSTSQIRRIIESCKKKGALLSQNYNKDQRDRTIWYSPSNDLLTAYGEPIPPNCICENQQMESGESADTFEESSEALPCIDHVDTNSPPYNPPTGAVRASKKTKRKRAPKSVPEHSPERFEQFWEVYPGGGKRIKTVEAWDALKPDDDLIDTMAKALKRQMASEQWRNGIGIPHASTWLNEQGWLDKVQESVAPAETSSGWAPDPEVTE